MTLVSRLPKKQKEKTIKTHPKLRELRLAVTRERERKRERERERKKERERERSTRALFIDTAKCV